MATFLRTFFISLILVLLILGAFITGYLFHERQETLKAFPLLNKAYEILINHGLNPPPADPALEYGMVRGMLQAYGDPHTVFVEPPQNELQSNALEGKFGGIGAQLGNDPNGQWLLFPFPDSPASRAGIQEADRLLKVEDLKITPKTPSDTILSAIRGPVGVPVDLSVGRKPDYLPTNLSIIREEILLPSVTWHLDPANPQVGVVKVNLIAVSTPDEILDAIKDLQERMASHFVLDLRDNPGGLLTAGVDIARLFLEDGIVMQQQYRGKAVETFKVERPGSLADIPVVVLINQGSASAAEITAGAIQVHGRALLIGVPSYGKDTVQLVFDLQDKSSLCVTAARWWIPNLDPPISEAGLQPDIIVDPSADVPGVDDILQAAIQHLISK